MRDPALWERIATLPLADPRGTPVGRLLLSGPLSSAETAAAVEAEYRRLLYLMLAFPARQCAPPALADLWGLQQPMAGPGLPGRFLYPPLTSGPLPGQRRAYAATWEAYRREFGAPPPARIWPAPGWEAGYLFRIALVAALVAAGLIAFGLGPRPEAAAGPGLLRLALLIAPALAAALLVLPGMPLRLMARGWRFRKVVLLAPFGHKGPWS